MHRPGSNSRPLDHKSDVLTTTPPIHLRLFVCQSDNSETVRDIITKFSGHYPVLVEEVDRFENDNIGVHGW